MSADTNNLDLAPLEALEIVDQAAWSEMEDGTIVVDLHAGAEMYVHLFLDGYRVAADTARGPLSVDCQVDSHAEGLIEHIAAQIHFWSVVVVPEIEGQ